MRATVQQAAQQARRALTDARTGVTRDAPPGDPVTEVDMLDVRDGLPRIVILALADNRVAVEEYHTEAIDPVALVTNGQIEVIRRALRGIAHATD